MTKIEEAVELYRQNNLSSALRLFSGFSEGFTEAERRVLEVAYECEVGGAPYYLSFGMDVDGIVKEAKKLIEGRYNVFSGVR